jgi:hypothetical protein
MAAAPTSPALPTPDAMPAPLSEGARIVNTFIAPSKTFTDLRNAKWWSWVAPWLLISIVAVAFFVVVGQKIGFRKVAENQIQLSPKATERMDRLSPEDREHAMEQQAKGTQYFTEYFYPAVILIFNVVIAGILLGTFKFGAGADLKFSTTLALVTYAGLPGIIRLLLAILSVLAGANPDSFSLQNPVATNPGYFMNPADSPFLFKLASGFDVFLIWTLVLSAIGFTCVSKVKRSTAFAIVFGWWLVFTVGGAAIGAAIS